MADDDDPFLPLTSARIEARMGTAYTIAGKVIENPNFARAATDKKIAAGVRRAIEKKRNKGKTAE